MSAVKIKYTDKLKDPRWQRVRLYVLERDDFTCTACGDQSSTLHVHHGYYIKDRNPWEYPRWSMSTLCENCHAYVHLDGWEYSGQYNAWENMIGMVVGDLPMSSFLESGWHDIAKEIEEHRQVAGDGLAETFKCWLLSQLEEGRFRRESK